MLRFMSIQRQRRDKLFCRGLAEPNHWRMYCPITGECTETVFLPQKWELPWYFVLGPYWMWNIINLLYLVHAMPSFFFPFAGLWWYAHNGQDFSTQGPAHRQRHRRRRALRHIVRSCFALGHGTRNCDKMSLQRLTGSNLLVPCLR